jgi:hypothetical protein
MKTKLSKIAIGMGLVLGMAAQAQAEGLYFNSGKLNGGADLFKEIASFDWLPGNYLSKGVGVTEVNETFTGYYQSELSRITYTNGDFDNVPIGPGGPLEITAGLEINEKVLSVSDTNADLLPETATFGHTGGTFTIYFDDLAVGNVNANGISGTTGLGYQDGVAIASGAVLATPAGEIGANYSLSNTNAVAFDQNGPNNWPTKTTYPGVGTSNISLNVDLGTLSSVWFRGAGDTVLTDPSIVTSFVLTNNNNPFGTINPESSVVGQTPTHLGGRVGDEFNSLTVAESAGCVAVPTGPACNDDFQFLADASQNFQVKAIPEPDGLSLLGIGVVGMALASRRRKIA